MHITTLSGSPSAPSRSGALLDRLVGRLSATGVTFDHFTIHDIPAEDLIGGRYDSPSLDPLKQAIARSQALIVTTPVYKASFAGGLKTVLDVLPEQALAGKVVLPLATAGSPGHVLALDYALKPVLSALGTRYILQGVYATDKQTRRTEAGGFEFDEEISDRLDDAAHRLSVSIREVKAYQHATQEPTAPLLAITY